MKSLESPVPDICLVIPPSQFLLDERVFVSLGILRVASSLENNGYVVDLLDLSGLENYVKVAENYRGSDMFGITATSPQMPAAVKIAKVVNGSTILGGPHVTLVNAAYRKNPKGRAALAMHEMEELFDVLVAGDGEEAILEAVNTQKKLIDADDVHSDYFLAGEGLDRIPARHLINMESYHYEIEGVSAASLIGQLGCPFECGFCGGRLSPTLRRMRTRSVDHIIDEVRQLHFTYGYEGFMFYDDELNVSKSMVPLMQGLIDLQHEVGASFRLRGFVKAELFTEEQAAVMYEAGFRWILTGFESGSEKILKNINKKATRADNTRCVKIAKDHGLKVKALMSLGHPGESMGTVAETHQWLTEARPEDFDLTIISCYPGTPYYDNAVKNGNYWTYTHKDGDRLHQVEIDHTQESNYYKGDPEGDCRSYVFTDYLGQDELVGLRKLMDTTLRKELSAPVPSSSALMYDHTMGQTA